MAHTFRHIIHHLSPFIPTPSCLTHSGPSAPPYVLRFTFYVLPFILLSFFLLPRLYAQTLDADVNFYALPLKEDKPYQVGDRITLRLEVKHPVGSQLEMFPLQEEWGDFEVVDQTVWKTVENDDGSATTGRDIIVTLFEPGQYQTPSLVLEHKKPDGSVEELGAPVIRLNVESVLVEGDEELRDIKPQAILPVPPIWPLVLAGLAAGLLVIGAAVGGGLWLYHRWRRQELMPELPLPMIDARPPEVIAYAELERIETLNLPANAQFKEHYSLVADCLRRYIEGRYQIPALDRTTTELREAFRTAPAPADGIRAFINLFKESDLVKFARFHPSLEEAYTLINRAREIVRITTPLFEPVVEMSEPISEPEVEVIR
jgi:hypothetical protein